MRLSLVVLVVVGGLVFVGGPPAQPVGSVGSKSKIHCQKFHGTFAQGKLPTVWTCSEWKYTNGSDDFSAKADILAEDCFGDGGNSFSASGTDPHRADANCSQF